MPTLRCSCQSNEMSSKKELQGRLASGSLHFAEPTTRFRMAPGGSFMPVAWIAWTLGDAEKVPVNREAGSSLPVLDKEDGRRSL
jgi:hypothetical protein